MWLIDTSSYELEFFASTDDVPFAILSHTWADDEVVFGDMVDLDTARRKAGWTKIEQTCLLALAHTPTIHYAWVDTCCIDKSSSSELTEAINSMFDFYRKAAICVVYLQDLHLTHGALNLESVAFQTSLRSCRWFSRGWTLQELVASAHIDFYAATWDYVGDKQELTTLLASITGINQSVLASIDTLWSVPVGVRMSWAAARETTRVEDLAYCLLGIFDVNMPLLYGEGTKAFLRLQDEIASASNDLTLFAWTQVYTAGAPTFRGIYATSPREFAGCANLRVPQQNLAWDGEFMPTNRGLRFNRNLAMRGPRYTLFSGDEGDDDLLMGLDCLEQSVRTRDAPRWVGIHLWRIGNIYVRYFPGQLHYTASRTQWRSPEAAHRVAYVLRTIPHTATSSIERKVSVSITYDNVLRALVSQALASTKRIFYRQGHSDQLHEVDVWGARGLESLVRLHIFKTDIGRQTIRLAVVCGLQAGPEANPVSTPWVALFHEGRVAHLPDNPISNKYMFRTGPSTSSSTSDSSYLDHAEKIARFSDYIFEQYSDARGFIKSNELPTTALVADKGGRHTMHIFHATLKQDVKAPTWQHRGPPVDWHVVLSYGGCRRPSVETLET